MDLERSDFASISGTLYVQHGAHQSMHPKQQNTHQSEPACHPTALKVFACQMQMVGAAAILELSVV